VATKRKFIFNDIVKTAFLESVRRTGLVAKSASAVGTSSRRIKTECEVDKDFGADFQEALVMYAESVQEELHRRAMEGVEEIVYFQGVECGRKINYSDSLLTTLVKAKSPEFREKLSVDTTIHGGVLCVLPQAPTTNKWLETANPAQLPAAPIEAEFEEGKVIDVTEED